MPKPPLSLVKSAGGDAGTAVSPRDRFVVASPQMVELLGRVERLAQLKWPVLIVGESGVGKEGVARALHDLGPRAARPFVAVNAGALPADLIDSELFGHERGAFTGATAARRGLFECADMGTLFLDEVGELPLDAQARLLRIVETWEVRRVGTSALRRVDVRLVCATNRDLRPMVKARTFREDLYYRLIPLVLEVPPLRERPGDLHELVDHFLERIGEDLGRFTVTDDGRVRLAAHEWPGNVRELRNVLCSAAAEATGDSLDTADIDSAITRVGGPSTPRRATQLMSAVEAARGNIAAAARGLGIPRTTLRDRLRAAARRR